MIDSIEVTNWKTHKSTKLEFQKGVNVLVGVMGSGKSSILDAISFALFGTFPILNSKRTSLSNLITSRPTIEKESEVSLSFTVDGETYGVTRRISQQGSTAKVTKNGAYLQAQPTKVTEEIANVLKIDYDTFSRVIYAEQNELDYFLNLNKGERKRVVDHMLGLDTFATAEENATSLINRLKDTIGSEEEMLARIDIKELREQTTSLKSQLHSLESEQKKMKEAYLQSRSAFDESKQKLESARKEIEKRNAITKKITELDGMINTWEKEVKKIEAEHIDEKGLDEAKDRLDKEYAELEKRINDSRKEETRLSKELSAKETEKKMHKRDIDEREKLKKELGSDSEDKIRDKIKEAIALQKAENDHLAASKTRIEELEKVSRDLEGHVGKCPVCERELDETHRKGLLEERKSAISKLKDEIKVHSRKSEELASELEAFNKSYMNVHSKNETIRKYSGLDSIVEQLEKECKRLVPEIENARSAIKDMEGKQKVTADKLNLANQHIKTVERKRGYESEISKAKKLVEDKHGELSGIKINENSMGQLEEEFGRHSKLVGELDSRIKESEKYFSSLKSQHDDKQKQIDSYEATSKRIEKKQGIVSNLNKFKTVLQETETTLRKKLSLSINNLMEELWMQLYPYSDYQSIRLTPKADDYLLEIRTQDGDDNESWMQVDGTASGGERSIACLTLRVALAMVVVPNLRWLILDEPTHNIDANGISQLVEVLGGPLPNFVEQIFIITHEESMKQIQNAKTFILERDKSINSSTNVSAL
ncbi:MAG: SMC family ATPase [Candidatus Marsarchaeota archaeon]|nr:SMC family ATPase [Candidatus Marsarchaeota archaeon]